MAVDLRADLVGRGATLLPAGARVVIFGNSIGEHNHRVTGVNELSSQSAGEVAWARALLPRFYFEVKHDTGDAFGRNFTGMNMADTADTLQNMAGATRLNGVKALNPHIVYVQDPINDITGGRSAVQIMGNLATIYNDFISNGIKVITRTALPCGAWVTPDNLTDPRYAVRASVNASINALNVDGLQVFDPNTEVEDFTSRGGAGGLWKAGYSLTDADTTHLSSRPGYYGGVKLAADLETLIAPGSIFDHTTGNLITNWQLAGTDGGANPGTAGLITGPGGGARQIASSWRVNRNSGNNAVAVETSKEADGDWFKQVITFKPGGSSTFENWSFQQLIGGTPNIARPVGIADGDWVRFFFRLELENWGDQCSGFDPQLIARDAGAVLIWQSHGIKYMDRTNRLYPAAALDLLVTTEPFQITTAMQLFTWQLNIYPRMNTAVGNLVSKFSRPCLKVVPDPVTYWS